MKFVHKTIALMLIGGMTGLGSCRYFQSEKEDKAQNTSTETPTPKKEAAAPSKELKFTTFSESRKGHIDNDAALPACTAEVSLVYPDGGYTGKLSLEQLQQLFLKSLPEGMQSGTTPSAAARRFIENYIREYQSEMSEYRKEARKKDNAWMNYETIVSSKSLYNKHDFWGYSVEVYQYTGGAHGISTTTYNVIDLKSGRPLSLQDLFAESDYAVINRMLRQQLADDTGTSVDKLDSDYDVDNIVVNDSFMLDSDAVTWLYNPYDIAPYSFGTIRIALPYRAIAGYLKTNSPLRRVLPE